MPARFGHALPSQDPLTALAWLPSADADTRFVLARDMRGRLSLSDRSQPKASPLQVDFGDGELTRRIRAGRQQALARACGLSARGKLRILDATAGLGRDAFCLAALGAQVTMFERNPLLHLMLEEALARLPAALSANISLMPDDSIEAVWPAVDTIYLDPMFPSTGKRAAPGLEMQYLQALIGPDQDAEDLWQKALQADAQRVVLKRPPRGANVRLGRPDASFGGTRVSYDVYLLETGAAARQPADQSPSRT